MFEKLLSSIRVSKFFGFFCHEGFVGIMVSKFLWLLNKMLYGIMVSKFLRF